MSEITITLHDPVTGRSESMPVPNTVTIQEIVNLGKALLGLQDGKLVLQKYGKILVPPEQTLAIAGVVNGDLLSLVSTPVANRSGGGGLDFSSLLGNGAAAQNSTGGNLDFSSLLGGLVVNPPNPKPVYYPGMSFHEAFESNPHPKAIVELLRKHSHLFKEFNYHMPVLARQIHQASNYEDAVEIWKKEMVKKSIQSAAATTNVFHKERSFQQRLQQNPNDTEAKEYFSKKDAQKLVNEQYRQAMEEYPESMGKILMLYINAKINNKPLQAFVDSGAQMTIMSKSCAQRHGIFHLLDTRFHGVAVGVGTGKILGRVHVVQLQIGDCYFPCSVTIMDGATLPIGDDSPKPKDMEMLLGLDMLKRFKCSIDLMHGSLKFQLENSTLETPFLHEKDLDESKGGTKGFDATKANQELEDAQMKYEEDEEKRK
mmetsp:Transcript_25443/g.29057  ORF Transcript_25443/g.29057 Transcript_25443/m.29057 type:complete len:428 (-) Transcript_25443:256-1539(-)